MDIECYYFTKNVLMKIQQNKSFHNLYKCATNTQKKNLQTIKAAEGAEKGNTHALLVGM